MKLYKLTDEKGRTYNGTQWGEGVTHSATGEGDLCGPGWIHAYTHPLLAVLLNPIHANFEQPRLWEAEGEVGKEDHGLKVGCKSLTTIREIPLPEVTTEQRVRFGILCAKKVYKLVPFVMDRSEQWYTWADSGQAAWAAAWAAARTAWAAARTAWAEEERVAAWAEEERVAAVAAAWAAEEEAAVGGIDLVAIAEEVVNGY